MSQHDRDQDFGEYLFKTCFRCHTFHPQTLILIWADLIDSSKPIDYSYANLNKLRSQYKKIAINKLMH